MAFRNIFFFVIVVISQGNVDGSNNVKCSNQTFALQAYMNETTQYGTIIESYIFNCTLNELSHLDSKDAFAYFEFKIAETLPDKTTITLTLRKQFDYLDKKTATRNYWTADFTVKHKFGKQDGILLLTVLDENTQKPKFDKSTYNYSIPESFPLDLDFTNIYGGDQIAAHDDDYPMGINNKLTFIITEKDSSLQPSQIFSVVSHNTTANGGHYLLELKLQHKLDYSQSQRYNLTLIAKDSSIETKVKVTVNVKPPEQGAKPKFTNHKYQENLLTSELKNDIIDLKIPIKATACFSNILCSPIKYELDIQASDDSATSFELDVTDKESTQPVITKLKIKDPITPMSSCQVILLVIKAISKYNEDFYDHVNLKIEIESPKTTTVSTTIETTKTTLCTMPDEITTPTTKPATSTTKPTTSTTLTTNPMTSTILTTNPMTSTTPRTEPTTPIITTIEPTITTILTTKPTVIPTESTTTTRSDELTTCIPLGTTDSTLSTISLEVINDHIKFSYPSYNAIINQIKDNLLVWTVSAGQFANYKAEDGSLLTLFNVHKTTGDITLISNSVENGQTYELKIVAYAYWDENKIKDRTQVNIKIDIENNQFGFEKSYYSFDIKENDELGKIGELDKLLQGFSYEIAECDDWTKFSFNDSFPEALYAKEPFDYETKSRYQIKIVIVSKGQKIQTSSSHCPHPSTNTEAIVVINVVDANEFPHFTTKYSRLGLSPSTVKGSLLISLEAEDPDEGSNGQLTFSLSETKFYALHSDGALYFMEASEKKIISLTASVSDKGNPPLAVPMEFKIATVKTKEMFVLTVHTNINRNRNVLRKLQSDDTSVQTVYENSKDTADFLEKLSIKTGLNIGLIPHQIGILADRIEFYLYAMDNNSSKILSYEEIEEEFKILAANIKQVKHTEENDNDNELKSEKQNDDIAIIILAVFLVALIVALIGIFIFKKWRKAKKSSIIDETETKEVSIADSKEFEIGSNRQVNPLYDDNEDSPYIINLSKEKKENVHQNGNYHSKTDNIFSKFYDPMTNNGSNELMNESNNSRNQQDDQKENETVGIYPKLSPSFAKLSDPEATFTELELEPLEDYYQMEIPSEYPEDNEQITTNEEKNSLSKHLNGEYEYDNNTVFFKDDEVKPADTEEVADLPKQKSSLKSSFTDDSLEDDEDDNEFIEDPKRESKKERKRLKSIVTFNEIPEVITLPSEEISQL